MVRTNNNKKISRKEQKDMAGGWHGLVAWSSSRGSRCYQKKKKRKRSLTKKNKKKKKMKEIGRSYKTDALPLSYKGFKKRALSRIFGRTPLWNSAASNLFGFLQKKRPSVVLPDF